MGVESEQDYRHYHRDVCSAYNMPLPPSLPKAIWHFYLFPPSPCLLPPTPRGRRREGPGGGLWAEDMYKVLHCTHRMPLLRQDWAFQFTFAHAHFFFPLHTHTLHTFTYIHTQHIYCTSSLLAGILCATTCLPFFPTPT